jgi:aminoglycoside phosphotransferase (APT) family kinase protein
MTTSSPTYDDLQAIVGEAFGVGLVAASRFPTGLCHYVYDAVLADGRAVVLRLARPANLHYLLGAIHWSGLLRPLGLPLPELLHARLTPACTPFPYIVLERLQGRDLGEMYMSMTGPQKETLARRLAGIQEQVGRLPEGVGFGFQSDPRHPPPHRTWAEVVDAGIRRSEQWIMHAGVVDGRRVEQAREAARGLTEYFDGIHPQPFLEDITTKNVLIHDGQLSGIVDVDEMCFGDRVAHLGLTRMALLASHLPTDYIDHWCTALHLSEVQRRALDFYTAAACLCFLGEQGQSFNRDKAPPVNRAEVDFLEGTLDHFLTTLQ